MSAADYSAIDPLAILLGSATYQRVVEGLHPHVPKVSQFQDVFHSASPEERAFALARARAFVAYGKAIEEAITALK